MPSDFIGCVYCSVTDYATPCHSVFDIQCFLFVNILANNITSLWYIPFHSCASGFMDKSKNTVIRWLPIPLPRSNEFSHFGFHWHNDDDHVERLKTYRRNTTVVNVIVYWVVLPGWQTAETSVMFVVHQYWWIAICGQIKGQSEKEKMRYCQKLIYKVAKKWSGTLVPNNTHG